MTTTWISHYSHGGKVRKITYHRHALTLANTLGCQIKSEHLYFIQDSPFIEYS